MLITAAGWGSEIPRDDEEQRDIATWSSSFTPSKAIFDSVTRERQGTELLTRIA